MVSNTAEVIRRDAVYLAGGRSGLPIAMAHRGGARHPANLGLENTLVAFQNAVELGYVYLETDVHATRDGVLVAFHDERLDRVTNRGGAIAALNYAEVAEARIGQTHSIPTMRQLFEAFPGAMFNIDLKSDAAVKPLVRLIDETQSWQRVLVGSFSWRRLREFRRLTNQRVPTSAAPVEVAVFR
ncbi:MAG: glycerophosphodiester phosphodiesterase family protein, partial [Nocardioides sp.]